MEDRASSVFTRRLNDSGLARTFISKNYVFQHKKLIFVILNIFNDFSPHV